MSENEGEVLRYMWWKQQTVFAFIKFEGCHLIVSGSRIGSMMDGHALIILTQEAGGFTSIQRTKQLQIFYTYSINGRTQTPYSRGGITQR